MRKETAKEALAACLIKGCDLEATSAFVLAPHPHIVGHSLTMQGVDIHRYMFFTATIFWLLILAGGVAMAAPSAVALHEPELPGGATVWCLNHKELFADSARAVGLDIGTAQDGATFQRPGDRTITLEEWSISPNLDDVEDFNITCLPAYEAFSPAGVRGGSSEDNTLTTFLSVLLGAGLATGSSVGVERWRSNRRDADELRRVSLELRGAVAEYISKPEDGPARERARAVALKLRAVLGDYDSVAPRDANQARDVLDDVLTGNPRIGDLGEDVDGEALMGKVSTARSRVKKVADRAAHPQRSRVFKQRK